MPIRDLTGQTFGRLVAIGPNGRSTEGQTLWLCICECWNSTVVRGNSLLRGVTKSCGCLRKATCSITGKLTGPINGKQNGPVNIKVAQAASKTHGHSNSHGNRHGTLTYRSWQNMRSRCTNPNNKHNWPRYGGRGIKVCDRWLNSFENFLADMGERPSKKYSINRIDNNRNYEPGNCEWTNYNPRGPRRVAA